MPTGSNAPYVIVGQVILKELGYLLGQFLLLGLFFDGGGHCILMSYQPEPRASALSSLSFIDRIAWSQDEALKKRRLKSIDRCFNIRLFGGDFGGPVRVSGSKEEAANGIGRDN